jgi:hypothetical protein
MNTLFKLAVLTTALIFGTTEALAVTTTNRSLSKPSYKSSYKPSSYKVVKPIPKPTPVKRKVSSSEDIEYFALQDCQRHITVTFNGYRCIDRN